MYQLPVQLWLDLPITRGERLGPAQPQSLLPRLSILFCKSNLPQVFDPIGSNITFPSMPMLAALIRGVLIVTGELALGIS